MCGRFTQTASPKALAELALRLGATPADEALLERYAPRYNLAPTQAALALLAARDGAPAHAAWLTFGLRRGDAGQVINGRAETLAERPMFSGLLAKERCLVLATGFYEWQPAAPGGAKVPHHFALQDDAPFAFAALRGRRAAGAPERACAAGGFVIVTTEANATVAPVHGRMPVILDAEAARLWLDPSVPPPAALDLLGPYAGQLRAQAVGRGVNNPRHDAPDCIAPA